jgi:hypothetical protein
MAARLATLFLVGICLPALTHTLDVLPGQTIRDAIPQLQGLPETVVYNPIGGLNFEICCLQAVKESYTLNPIPDDEQHRLSVEPTTPAGETGPFITLTADALNRSQFPCGAEYDGDKAGAPLVQVPYRWCKKNCPGWQKSHNRDLSQWIQPFVGYILPAAVFALSVRLISLPVLPNSSAYLELKSKSNVGVS